MNYAVLIGHNFNSILGLARALGKEGYRVGAIRTGGYAGKNPLFRIGQTPEANSRYISKYIVIPTKEIRDIISLLLSEFASKEGKGILFPVDDVCAKIIDEHMNELKPFFFLPNVNNEPGGVLRLMDKYYQKELAKKAELPVPNGWSIPIKNGAYQIPVEITYPCFAKTEMPMVGRKSYMGKCSGRAELEMLLNNTAANYSNCSMIVEEYVEIEKEYCIVGVCDRDAVVIPDVIDECVLGHGEHAGVTCFGKVLKPSSFDTEFLDKLKAFLRLCNFQGLFTVDVFQSENKLFFGELNLRIGGSGIAVIGAGVNIALITAEILQGNTTVNTDQICKEITFASERPLVNDLVTGFISYNRYKDYLNKADFRFVESEEDKEPLKRFKWYIARQLLRKMTHKL